MSEETGTLDRDMRENANRAMKTIIVCVLFLIAVGWVMLVDTGLIFEGQANPEHFQNLIFKRAIGMGCGFLLLGAIWLLPSKLIRYLSFPVMILAVFLLALVFTSLGIEERGSTRWERIGPVIFQPLELAKLAFVWFLADQLARIGPISKAISGKLIFPAIAVIAAVLMVGLQPNLSGAIFLILLTFAMAWLGGLNGRLALGLTGGGVVAFLGLLALNPDRFERFLPVFRPLTDLEGSGYQVGLSIWAVTTGGLFGSGPGHSVAMYSLPDHTTDFVYSIICEEWGFIGGIIVIALFAVLVLSGFRLALAQRDKFRILLGCGITTIIGLQAAINIGVALGLLPTTGMPLPFISAGGSNLVMSFIEIGILMNLGKTAGIRSDETGPKGLPSGDLREYTPRAGRTRRKVIKKNYRPARREYTSAGSRRRYERDY